VGDQALLVQREEAIQVWGSEARQPALLSYVLFLLMQSPAFQPPMCQSSYMLKLRTRKVHLLGCCKERIEMDAATAEMILRPSYESCLLTRALRQRLSCSARPAAGQISWSLTASRRQCLRILLCCPTACQKGISFLCLPLGASKS
jgi:hypothetical protein